MLLSYSHKFVFIHIYRVAGTSIVKSLEKCAKEPVMRRLLGQLRVGGIVPYSRWKTFPSHIKARELRKQIPEGVYDNFYKFAFVRNPWDWQVSLYHYMLRDTAHLQHALIKSMKDFDEYIDWRVSSEKRLQKDFVTDRNGELIVDFVGRYESLLEDFQHVCETLKVTASLPHLNKSPHMDYRSYYTSNSIKIIEENFKDDIEFFGYSF